MPDRRPRRLPSRLRRLDGALADLPLEEPMLLSELDGFLTGLLVTPAAIAAAEWMEPIWGSDDGSGVAPFDDPFDVQWFATAVLARRAEIARDLDRGRLQPLFDVDERDGEVLWEPWLDGFAEATALRPAEWAALADDAAVAEAIARLSTLIAVANEESALDSVEINALQDRAPAELVDCVLRLHRARPAPLSPTASPADYRSAPPGRNDPCACGSGKKAKRCCL